MDKYDITGMSCAACSARVEKAVSRVPGVTSCSVSLLTNSMGVEGTADPKAIIKAVTDAGYGASPAGGSASDDAPADKLTLENEREKSVLKRRLILSVAFLLALMYFSMGHMMWNFPAPKVFDNPVFLGIFEMLLSGLILIINSAFFTSGFRSLFKGGPNMNTLVALGSSVAFGFSLVELFLMADALWTGDHMRAMELGDNLYFESAAMIPTLITVGKLLEAISKGRTTDALKGLMKLTPKTATVVRNGSELTVPASEVVVDDIFLVRPGESIPVDGVIIEGSTGIDESALTGESIPAEKETGSSVYAATINRTGFIKCRAIKVGEDTTLAGIIRIMSDAAATKAPLARIADKVSAVFVPAVIVIALITFGVWLILGQSISFSVARAITVLVISCPCALGLATPVAVMVGSGVGAKHGILYKTAASLESLGRSKIVVLDKTGTITTGTPVVTDIIPAAGLTERELLLFAASLEAKSEHPLAGAVTDKAKELGLSFLNVTDFSAVPGLGLTGTLSGCPSDGSAPADGTSGGSDVITAGTRIFGGNLKYISEKATLSPSDIASIDKLAEAGKTPLLFAKNGAFAGIIAVRDNVKEDSVAAIKELKDLGLKTVMLTGDNERTARAIGLESGVDEIIAGVLPDEKSSHIERLKQGGKTVMVGDGINDAPALVNADTGIAIGAGADIAIDAADIVVVKSRLTDVTAAIRLSRATIKNIHENLFWAFFYNLICIPLAAGVYGLTMKPMYGALAMSLSSFCVCMNALRLNLAKIYTPEANETVNSVDSAARPIAAGINADDENKPEKNNANKDNEFEKETAVMKKTMKIEGMMCGHCEARVQKALLAVDGVTEAVVSHEKGTAELTLSKEVADEVLKEAVEAQDYKVTGIE